jgi:hypothetical protein
MSKSRSLVLLVVALLATVGTAAAMNRNFSVHLNGDNEVPVRVTGAQGQAIFHLSKDGSALEYKLIVANIENLTQAHIHLGPADATGPIVVWLFPSAPPATHLPGRSNGVLATGTITAANLVGPLAGSTLTDLIAHMEAGNAYVNVHTNDLIDPPNTGPGDFPGGEIRGQLP